MKPVTVSAAAFTLVAALGAATASAATLTWTGAFPEPPTGGYNAALAEARGWSAVTLVGVVPLSLVALGFARRGCLPGRLIWLGTLAYFFYMYLELAVGPPFTPLYLVYVTSFASALVALVMGTAATDPDEVAAALADRAPRRSVAGFGLLVGAGLSLAWLKSILERTVAGEFGWPQGMDAIGHVVQALDLGLQVPLALAAAILLLQRRAAGYLVAAILLVNGACMAVALTAMVTASALAQGRPLLEAAPFALLAVVALALMVSYLLAARGAFGSIRPAHAA